MDTIEVAKKKAAYTAVNDFIKDGMIVGIGSGSTIVYVVERLAQRVKDEGLSIMCIPTSFQARNLIIDNHLTLTDLAIHPTIDVAIDGADEVDENLQLIKGGGGCQTQEKIIASNAKQFVVVADHRKESKFLGEKWRKGIPIEVIPLSYVPLMKKWEGMGGKPVLRMGKESKMGPCVTDNGNFIVDVDFGVINSPKDLNLTLRMMPGVVETGLFIDMAVKAYFGLDDGSVKEVTHKDTSK